MIIVLFNMGFLVDLLFGGYERTVTIFIEFYEN